MTFGFVILAAGNVVCLYLAPQRLPARRLYPAFGYTISNGRLYVRSAPQPVVTTEQGLIRSFSRRPAVPGSEAIIDAVNAVETMLAGLIGSGIGALAYRHAKDQ
jgi:hypothetical protein